ncbi:MAG: hypothetical protein R3F54_15625 [Alphaproteobacteria bacterium]
MTVGSDSVAWRRIGDGSLLLLVLLLPLWTASAAPTPSANPAELTSREKQIVTRQVSLHPRDDIPASESRFSVRLIEARQVLLELQVFVEEAARTVELGKQLKSRRLENERLRRLLQTTEAARSAYEVDTTPAQALVSKLTRRIVDNWLESVRLQQISEKTDRDLDASEQGWRALEARLSTLRQTLVKRRAELRALRAESDALNAELQRTRQLIDDTHADTQEIEREQHQITNETRKLRRKITSKLRAMLLEDETL